MDFPACTGNWRAGFHHPGRRTVQPGGKTHERGKYGAYFHHRGKESHYLKTEYCLREEVLKNWPTLRILRRSAPFPRTFFIMRRTPEGFGPKENPHGTGPPQFAFADIAEAFHIIRKRHRDRVYPGRGRGQIGGGPAPMGSQPGADAKIRTVQRQRVQASIPKLEQQGRGRRIPAPTPPSLEDPGNMMPRWAFDGIHRGRSPFM